MSPKNLQAKALLAIAEYIAINHPEKLKWDQNGYGPWYSPDTCSWKTKIGTFYYQWNMKQTGEVTFYGPKMQHSAKKKVPDTIKYFRISSSYKQWICYNVGVSVQAYSKMPFKTWFTVSSRYIKIGKWFNERKSVKQIKEFVDAYGECMYDYENDKLVAIINKEEAPIKPTTFQRIKYAFKRVTCRHSNMEHDGYGGPESGGGSFHCPDCHFQGSYRLY